MVLWSCLGTIHVACARAKHRRMRRRFAHHDGSQRRPGGRERANDASLVLRDGVASTPYPLMGSDRVPSEVARFIVHKPVVDVGRYPRGSGARTVVARPPSGRTRRAPRAGEWDPARAPRHPRGTQWGEAAAPPCSHSLFESQFESPTRRPTGTWRRPLGVPVGRRDAPSGSARRAEWDLGGAEWEVRQHRVGPASRTLPRPTRPRGGRLDPEMAPVALATNLQGRRRRQRARRENRPPMQAHKGSPYPSDAS